MGSRAEFFKIDSEDQFYEKMVIAWLERRGKMVEEDALDDPVGLLESHLRTRIMKEIVTLSTSNVTVKDYDLSRFSWL